MCITVKQRRSVTMFGLIFDIIITVFCVILLYNFFLAVVALILIIVGTVGVVDHHENIYWIPLILGFLIAAR